MKVKHRTVSITQDSEAKKASRGSESEPKNSVKPRKLSKQQGVKDFLSLSETQRVRRNADRTKDLFIFTKIHPSKPHVPEFFSDSMAVMRNSYSQELYGRSGGLNSILRHFDARDVSFYYAHFPQGEAIRLFSLEDLRNVDLGLSRTNLLFNSSEFYDSGDELQKRSGLYYMFTQGVGVRKDKMIAEYLLSHLSADDREMTLTFSLSSAARDGDLSAAVYFLKAGANPDRSSFDSMTYPLSVAVRNKQLGSVELLLEAGADPHHAKNRFDPSPFDLADPHGPIREALLKATNTVKLFKPIKKGKISNAEVLKVPA